MEECMAADSPLGQVISLSSKRLVQDVPAPGAGDAVLRAVLSGAPFDQPRDRNQNE